MRCETGCHKRENLQQFNGHLHHWTEAETKSDSQVKSLINVAGFVTFRNCPHGRMRGKTKTTSSLTIIQSHNKVILYDVTI